MNNVTRQILISLLYVVLIVWLAYTVWIVRYTLIYVLISAVISLMGKPIVDALNGQRWAKINLNRSLAAALTLFLMIGFIGGLFSIFVPALMSELSALAEINFDSLFTEIRDEVDQLQAFLGLQGSDLKSKEAMSSIRPGISEVFNIENVTDTFTGLIGSLGNLAFAIFSIIFITFFFMREKFLFRNIIMAFVPDKYEDRVGHVSPRLRTNLSRYFVGLLIQITIITTLVSVGLKLAGFHNTIVIGFFAGLINVIPYLGPMIGASFGLVIGMAQAIHNPSMELGAAFFFIFLIFASVQLIDNFITQPFIFSTSIRAHPLEIFLVISFAASLAGIAGMIVAVPVYSVLRLLAAEFFPHVKFVRWLTQSSLNDEENPD